MVQRQHRERVRADLVRKIAVRRDPIGAHDDEIDLCLTHQRSRRGVRDQGTGDAGVSELPCGEPRSLQHRPRLVYEHVQAPPRLVSQIDRGERGADPAGRERPGVAVREHRGAVGDEWQPRFADAAAHGAVFLPDGRRLGPEPLPQRGAVSRGRRRPAGHPVERPPEIDGRRPARGQQAGQLRQPAQEFLARCAAPLPRSGNETHRCRDPDQRSAPHLQRPDRLRYRLRALEVALDPRLGKRPLVNDADGAGGRPGDGLDAHGCQPTA